MSAVEFRIYVDGDNDDFVSVVIPEAKAWGIGKTLTEAFDGVREDIEEQIRIYAETPDEDLAEDAVRMKRFFERIGRIKSE